MSAADRKRAWIVGAIVFVALAPGAFLGLPGKSVAGAWRVLDGDVPYRDFWTMYAPGQFYAVAALLAISGKQVIVPALVGVAIRAATASTLFALLRELGVGARVATFAAVILGLSLFELSPELSSYPPAIALIVYAWLQLARYASDAVATRLVRAGFALGVAAVFKHDVAAYGAASCALGLALASMSSQRPSARLSPARAVARLLLPAAAIVSVVAIWLAFEAGRDALQDLVLFPLGDFRVVRGEPYPGWLPNLQALSEWMAERGQLARARDAAEIFSGWILGHAPELAFVIAAFFVARKRRELAPARLLIALTMLATLPLFWWAAHTQQNTHFTTMAIASFVLGALMWSERAFRPLLAAGAIVYTTGLAIVPLSQLYIPFGVWSEPVALGVPHTLGVCVSPRERDVYRAVDDFARANLAPGEPIHCGVARHDAIVINNPRFHFLTDHPPATRYHELHPGITDRGDVQREMIADLEREHVRCAVLWRFGWPSAMLDNIVARRVAAIPECGAKLLDEYFATKFEPVLERGEYVVLWRRGEPRNGR